MLSPLKGQTRRDLAAVLKLNNHHERETSFLTAEKLEAMIANAFYAVRAPEMTAFLITFDQDADYDSDNFLWFKQRFDRFVYIDRIVVDPANRGQGLARGLYEALFEATLSKDQTLIACEVNKQPPNPGSDAFHTALGFTVTGSASSSTKSVTYYVKKLET